ncbi:MAG: ABC transporter ATP-binding protein [Deltaproteobacteria bacterium]|nr:ABC transporter ATP-binding protein [Deltaproteobacteria bacterium]
MAAEGATKIYNPGQPDEVVALHAASVSFRRGELAVLKGPSGSGKTTLLSVLGCMSRPTAGRVIVQGRDVAKLPEQFLTEVRRKTFGFIFQQFHLVKGVDVLENVLLPLYPLSMGFREMGRRAEEVLTRLRIWDKRRVKANRLSGGEQQRVAIARALINDPEIVVADEPTAHLDSELSSELLELLGELQREGRTVLIATHDPQVYGSPLVQRVIEMRDGRVVSTGKG